MPDREIIEFQESNVLSYLKWIEKHIGKKDIIILQGGGNLGNLYRRYEYVRRTIVKKFPENKIIVFPQSISYSCDAEGKYESVVGQKTYSKHKKLTIFARDSSSYEMMRKLYNNVDIRLCPDIVFSLFNIVSTEERHGVGVCIRNDKESSLSDAEKNLLLEELYKRYSQVSNFNTMVKYGKDIVEDQRRDFVLSKLREISQYELVITDRLHGMIFAYITSTPCIALNNITGKSYYAYKDWLVDKENVIFLNNELIFDKLPNAIKSVELNFRELENVLVNEM